METTPITRTGYNKLTEELTRLKKKEMPEVVEAIGIAREFGDISENAEYHASKERQGMIMAKIADLETKLGQAQVIDCAETTEKVVFGCQVTVCDLDTDEEYTYRIVGPWESDADNKDISYTSPIGKALLGAQEGDEIKVKTPRGTRELEVVSID